MLTVPVSAAQKAKIADNQAEVYELADFDSDVIGEVFEGESYFISNEPLGPFYKIKLKNGKIGFIVDYALEIEGKGRLQPQDLDNLSLEEERKRLKKAREDGRLTEEEMEEEESIFGKTYAGPTLQLINYHENTLGSDQVADLIAIGYKSSSQITWSVLGSFTAPKYYAAITGGSAKGVNIWADVGYSSLVASLQPVEFRFGGSFFAHGSFIQLDTPARKYQLDDVTVGIALEGTARFKIKRSALEFAIKYYFDRSSYAGFGLSYLF